MKVIKITAVILLLLVGLLGLFLLWASFTYNIEYVSRVLRWGESDSGDYLNNFPHRPLQPAAKPFYFDEATEEEQVTTHFETLIAVDDFDTSLEETGQCASHRFCQTRAPVSGKRPLE